MSKTDTLSLDLFGQISQDSQTSLHLKKAKNQSLSSAKKKQTPLKNSNYLEVSRLKNTVHDSYCCKMVNEPTHIPCGKYYGALPDKLILNGVHWIYIGVEMVGNIAFTTIKSTISGEYKVLRNTDILSMLNRQY